MFTRNLFWIQNFTKINEVLHQFLKNVDKFFSSAFIFKNGFICMRLNGISLNKNEKKFTIVTVSLELDFFSGVCEPKLPALNFHAFVFEQSLRAAVAAAHLRD